MGVQATYELHVDWDNDGSFATSGDDISSDFRSGEISRGYYSPLARMPLVGRASFIVKNVDSEYSPPSDATRLPYRPVRFRMTYDGDTVVQFRGFIESIVPAPGQFAERTAVINCVDAMQLLDLFEGKIAVQEDTFSDSIISTIVSNVYTPPGTNYQSGKNRFPTSADRWSLPGPLLAKGDPSVAEEIQASLKIMDACASDWGRFFIAKNGNPTFFNRHQMPLDSSTELTLNGDMTGMAYEKRVSEVYNIINVTYLPRTVGETNEVVGRFAPDRTVQIKPSTTEEFTIRYKDPSNSKIKIGALDLVTPVAGTDYDATSDEQGEGTNVNSILSVTFNGYADHADIKIENTDNSIDAFIQYFRVRGKAVRSREPETIVSRDSTSIDTYGQRRLPVSATLMSDSAQAQALSDYLLSVYKDPQDIVTGVEITANRNDTMMNAVKDLELMDKIDLTETQTGLSNFEGHIYHMHHVINTKYEHRLIISLETPYDVGGTPFNLGDALNSGNILIY